MDLLEFEQQISTIHHAGIIAMREELQVELLELETVLDDYIQKNQWNSIEARSTADAMEHLIQQLEIIEQHLEY